MACTSILHADDDTYDLWYTILMSGQPSGYSHQSSQRTAGGNLLLQTQTQITIARQAIKITIQMDTTFQESADGKPLRGSLTQTLGTMKMIQKYTFNEDGSISMTSEQNGQVIKQELPKPTQKWLTPTQSQKYVLDQLAKGQKEISFVTIEPASGPQPITIKMKYIGQETVQVIGKVVPAMQWEMTTSLMPGMITRAWTNDKIIPIKTSMTPMPGMEMDVLLSDKNLATQQVNPPELLISTMIHPNKPLPNPRSLKQATYELIIKPSAAGEPKVLRDSFIQTGSQRVKWIDDYHVQITVNVKSQAIKGEAKPDAKYLKATPVLNHQDPQIKQAIIRALGNQWDQIPTMERAVKLCHFVNGEIKSKDLSVGFASASEVIRTRQGDCSEHGVLLAAMLRGVAIPSRVVSGLIYVDEFLGQKNIFGYHMWSQAWIDGQWVDLDATLLNVFDAAHIAMVASSTGQGQTLNDMVKLTPLIGRLSINVLSVR
ncbi:MAG: transglutaminase domain-containing protein [Phycisphaeraceae bacterium]|nr:transglutaminase domain-containing protein [Phycisphaeraceae bacterium]